MAIINRPKNRQVTFLRRYKQTCCVGETQAGGITIKQQRYTAVIVRSRYRRHRATHASVLGLAPPSCEIAISYRDKKSQLAWCVLSSYLVVYVLLF